MRIIFFVVLLHLMRWLGAAITCNESQHASLNCFNDYDQTITCIWNNSDARTADGRAPCSLHAERQGGHYKSQCLLRPVDASTPSSLQICSLVFGRRSRFQQRHRLRIWFNCSNVMMSYRPACHVKLPPPEKPQINQTTISWVAPKREWNPRFSFQLEWKMADEPWNGATVHREDKDCNRLCRSELSVDQLVRGTEYEVRVRVKSSDKELKSVWSDWSASARWTSDIGMEADSLWLVLVVTVSGIAFAICLAFLIYKTDKTHWVYAFKKIRGPRLPDPRKSSLQNKWASPPFNSESFQSFLCPVDILPVNSVGCSDPEELCYPGGLGYLGALVEKMMMVKTTRVSFLHPKNSQLWPSAPPVASLTLGDLQPCDPDSPYGHVGPLMDQDGEMKDTRHCFLEVVNKLSKSSSEVMPVISDYEKIEKHQREHEVEESEGKHGGNEKSPFEEIFIKSSIQLSLDNESIQMLHQDEAPELPSVDSGIGSVGEGHGGLEVRLDDGEEKGSRFFHCCPDPGPGSPLSCHRPTLVNLHALMLDATNLTCGSVQPSSGGYMPVCPQEDIKN
ncbi:uncharacterized protein LOC133506390 [Syngnathoides biaculeatus]|uniref:uncharacterized protein LOC133506390 n=1 Tax=Syngnathoides biaculeatus TaxID=300417 RepID=UPI002ADE14AE|nr:uncharacterized protein LOC133506390 [Syngnathoides biaculeatus]XP_061686462.1 uncharacterized protein LOC133506390 [Syngnathoides biaculeatus]XP_061686463.1 uncharacterized protein LOC133506390 [Syngnathoides biaculeatus]